MSFDPHRLTDLDQQVRAMAACDSPAAVFKALLAGARAAAPRAAVFLVRQGAIQGWGSLGYAPDATQSHRRYSCPVGQGWLGQLVSGGSTAVEERPEGVGDPDFGQGPAAGTMGAVVRLKQKPIAVLVAERSEGEAWFPNALGLLVTVAQLRLELDLVERKLKTQDARPQASQPATARPAAPPPPVAPAAQAQPAAETTQVAEVADSEPPQMNAARRYARLVATDIRLYNEDAVMAGRRNGDLLQRLGEQLDRGKETFLRRHGDLGPTGLDILHQAYVKVLAAGDPKLIPSSVLE